MHITQEVILTIKREAAFKIETIIQIHHPRTTDRISQGEGSRAPGALYLEIGTLEDNTHSNLDNFTLKNKQIRTPRTVTIFRGSYGDPTLDQNNGVPEFALLNEPTKKDSPSNNDLNQTNIITNEFIQNKDKNTKNHIISNINYDIENSNLT
ncbi:hypothetical protein JTE90_028220 [Oedothorax gibbosus]|uniref:Uncharacterized protein n=1 Tax=Oedothorax gibbosus TaxID=931172 RepID=A0AAV6TTX2_9ARAC|nr:hypothetical protein JTE90_028220 [Oedothorax gibbosus]